ncbi:hypothetical protein TWF730_006457 [Orbilia blumenaviensis]|uniref:chitinase n=1 Tax=Orbilia blumenaviensis TaxID=1796055 RepID=A0AAV9VKL7_9PEZI
MRLPGNKTALFGLTTEFCSKSAGCQNNCDTPAPKCTTSGLGERRVGYYASWATTRRCAAVPPAKIKTTGLTHLIYSFASIDPYAFKIAPATALDSELFGEVTALKRTSPGLKVFIAVGGWAFNDPGPTRETFSKMAASAGTRKIFIDSVMAFMRSYGFDGIDIDWEYPTAEDRGGKPGDTANYVLLVREMKQAFTTAGGGWGISVAIPASYWYLQHFNLAQMASYIDWFNLMSYDYVGTWDKDNKWTGPYVGAHTNLTMTQQALDLMWRSNVSGSKINMGLGFYGRSFTLKNKACTKPGCEFTRGGTPGRCSEAEGILMNIEIQDIQKKKKVTPVFDKVAGVKYMSWDNQWVSYDDAESIAFKRHWAASKCLGGLMIWALDQDTPDNVGLAAAIGVTPGKFVALAATQEKPPRTNCYVAFCGDKCIDGYSIFGYGGGRFSSTDALGLPGACHNGKLSSICCPSNSMTTDPIKSCGWSGNENLISIIGPGPTRKRAVGDDGPTAPGLCKVGCPAGLTQIAQNTVTISPRISRVPDEQWSHAYCLEGYASYCCPNFNIDPNRSPPPLLYEDTGTLRKRGFEYLLGPLFNYGIMFKELYIDPEPVFKPLKIGIEIGGKEVTGFPALPSDEAPWDEFLPDIKNVTSSISDEDEDMDSSGEYVPDSDDETDSDDDSTPTGYGYHDRPDTTSGRWYGNHRAVASRRGSSTKRLTYTCTYNSYPQVCENIRSGIEVQGAAQVVHYIHRVGNRVIPERWKAQHGQRNAGPIANPWLVYTPRPIANRITQANGNVITRITNPQYPTCEVPWDDITVTWTNVPPAKMGGGVPWHSSYDLGQNTACFPARGNNALDRISDPAFAVMTDDRFVSTLSSRLSVSGVNYRNSYPTNGIAAQPNPSHVNFNHILRRDMSPNPHLIPLRTEGISESNDPSRRVEEQPIMLQPTKKFVTVPIIAPTNQPDP